MLSKKIFALTVLFFAAFFAGQHFVSAQTKKPGSTYDVPSRLELPDDKNEESLATRAIVLLEHIYPIGWSKDGKFAYYSEPPDEACGCYFADLFIQDMRTDKILWTSHFEGGENEDITIRTLWKRKQKEFSRKLKQYGIVAQGKFKLETTSINYENDVFTPNIKFNINEESDFHDLKDVALRIDSKNLGSKLIYGEKFDPKKFNGILHIEIAGSLLSPFEPRAVVIVVATRRGWEGPPNTTEIIPVGANLTTGFK